MDRHKIQASVIFSKFGYCKTETTVRKILTIWRGRTKNHEHQAPVGGDDSGRCEQWLRLVCGPHTQTVVPALPHPTVLPTCGQFTAGSVFCDVLLGYK